MPSMGLLVDTPVAGEEQRTLQVHCHFALPSPCGPFLTGGSTSQQGQHSDSKTAVKSMKMSQGLYLGNLRNQDFSM